MTSISSVHEKTLVLWKHCIPYYILTPTYLLFLGITAVHYGVGCGDIADTVISSSIESVDIQHPVNIRSFTKIDVSPESLLHIGQSDVK